MIMTGLNLILSLLIPFSAGYTLLGFLFPNRCIGLFLKIALAFGLGLGLLSIWMLVLGICQLPFNSFVIGSPLIITAALFYFLGLRRKKVVQPTATSFIIQTRDSNQLHGSKRILHIVMMIGLIVYIALNIFYVFWRATAIPIATWDAIATVAFKAKVFYYEQSLPSLDHLPHKTYPLFVPFVQSWIAFNLGYWDNFLIKIIFPCAFLSYLIAHYKFLGHYTNRTSALLGSAILLSSNLFIYHATISYRDFFLMYFNCITVMLLVLWNNSKVNGFLILAGLFAGFATFTKLEGTAFLGVYFIIFSMINFPSKTFSIKEKLVNTMKFCIPSFGISFTFHIYKVWNKVLLEGPGIVDKTRIDLTWEKISLIPQILTSFLRNLLLSGNWNIIWLLALLSSIHLVKKRKNAEIRLILLSLILFFGLYIGVAVLTINYVWIAGAKSSTTLSRLILHFFPLSVLLIILLNYSGSPQKRGNTSP